LRLCVKFIFFPALCINFELKLELISAMAAKHRLDKLLLASQLAPTRQKAQSLIIAGLVRVNGERVDKPGTLVAAESRLEITGDACPYVSRGGLKLAAGLDHFSIVPEGMVCADVGASTGGFTDCLLQRGATRVYAIDVGYGQLAWKLRQDPRVVVMERTNARKLQPGDIPEPLDLAVIDASFISLKLLVAPLLPFFRTQISILALIKPQFEAGKERVGKGGVIRDPDLHQQVTTEIVDFAAKLGLHSRGVIPSPLLGPKGNREFLIHLVGKHPAAGIVGPAR
jgi:23S rRNA (cytidine1920-2'-O)/16S rRNA (cytidine1409-2'-O)-methyltransferase